MRVQEKNMYNSISSVSETIKKNKKNRMLTIYDCLKNRTGINKLKVSDKFGVSKRTIQWDIGKTNLFLRKFVYPAFCFNIQSKYSIIDFLL